MMCFLIFCILLFVLSESNAGLVLRMIRIITLQVWEQLIIILHGSADGIACSAKLLHEILGVANGGLIATTKMILQRDKNRFSIACIDDIGCSAPTVYIDFFGIVILKSIQNIEMLYTFVVAVSQLDLKMAIIFGDIKVSFFFLITKT